MKARAPGKLVLSGAYSVLEGAPALGVAVGRYAVADASRRAPRDTDEMCAAVELGLLDHPVWFDASALRERTGGGSRKLGLGSSAAVLVAALAAWHAEARVGAPPVGVDDGLAERIFPMAYAAHRRAQPAGSGIDVAVACHGGVLRCGLGSAAGSLTRQQHALPDGAVIRVFASPRSASTAAMLASVDALRTGAPATFRRCIDRAAWFAERVVGAVALEEVIAALRGQFEALAELGVAAAIPIVESAVDALARVADAQGAVFGPAGAGGGDVAFYLGPRAPTPDFVALARSRGLRPLDVTLGVRGVHCIDSLAGAEGEP